eukprot:2241246-Heterocapsa_arctica.AAC.1
MWAFRGFGAFPSEFCLSGRRPGSSRNDADESAQCSFDFATPAFPRQAEGGAFVDSLGRSGKIRSSGSYGLPSEGRESM